MSIAHVLVLYNEPVLPADHPDADSEHEILLTVDTVTKNLVHAGFQVSRLGANDPQTLVDGLRAHRPDVVFNLFEGTADAPMTEMYVAGVLDWFGLPFTGCPAHTLTLARHKHHTKLLLRGAGLPTPSFFVIEDDQIPECSLEYPVIVKPAMQDASVGIDQGSVVTTQAGLEARVRLLLERYGAPILVERFIHGRELSVGLVEAPTLRTLPIAEILFVSPNPQDWPIATYDAKWMRGTHDFDTTPIRNPAELSKDLGDKLRALACQTFKLLGCRDYARVDFRVGAGDEPFILEVNPNPDFSPWAGLASGLRMDHLTHSQFTVDMVRAALARGKTTRVVALGRSPCVHAVRNVQSGDREPIRRILDQAKALRPDERAATLAAVDQSLGAALADGAPRGDVGCRVAEIDGRVSGVVCWAKVPQSDGTYQLLGVALAPEAQRRGLGQRMLGDVEVRVCQRGGKILFGETGSNPESTAARRFFQRAGFRLAADLPDFYREGDGRLIYVKYLAGGLT